MSTLSIVMGIEADSTVAIRPVGEIDGDNAHEIRERVNEILATSAPTAIKVDMGRVSFIDSIGIGVLVACYHAAAASSVRLTVTNPTSYVHRILYISGLLGLFGSPARPPENAQDQRWLANPVG